MGDRSAFEGRVIVVTGASAGVGRATALALGEQGARVGLVARSAAALEETAREVEARGGKALPLPLDVADAAAVDAAAARCEAELGPIEAWVNAAMLTVFSPVSALAPEEIARVTQVTYLGAVHGTLAALRRMRPRNRGCIVQVGSALAFRGIPLQAPYCAAKHAIRGFTDSVRAELLHEESAIKVSEVHLPAVNTPQFDWARAHAPSKPKPVGKIHAPQLAAAAVLQAIAEPRREYWLGASTAQTIFGQAALPSLMDRMMANMAWDGQLSGEPLEADRQDNLEAPVEGLHAVSGRFSDEETRTAPLFSGEQARIGLMAAGAALFAVLGALAGRGALRRPDGRARRRLSRR